MSTNKIAIPRIITNDAIPKNQILMVSTPTSNNWFYHAFINRNKKDNLICIGVDFGVKKKTKYEYILEK